MLLPAPGGPPISREWPPAAAISSTRLAAGWPRICDRQGLCPASSPGGGGAVWRGSRMSPFRCAHSSVRLFTARVSAPARAASSPLPAGTTRVCPARAAARAPGRIAGTGLSAPDRASSPIHSMSFNSTRPSWPLASRMPTAIGRSKRPPSLGRSAGARLTVMRCCGMRKPPLISAERTRSLLSRTAVSGRPTMVKPGRPGPRWISTRTGTARIPRVARLCSRAIDMSRA